MKKSFIILSCILLLFAFQASALTTTGLQAYFKFSYNLVDYMNTHNGSFVDGAHYNASYKISNGSLGMLTDGDYMSISGDSSAADLSKSTSIGMWTYWYSDMPELGMLYSGGTASMGGFKMQVAMTTGAITCRWATTGGEKELSGGNLANQVWTHIACVFDDANDVMYIYVNGTNVTSASVTAGTNISTETASNFRFGGWYGHTSNDYKGLVDELFFFNRTLTPADISYLYDGNNPGTEQQPPFTAGQPHTIRAYQWYDNSTVYAFNLTVNNGSESTTYVVSNGTLQSNKTGYGNLTLIANNFLSSPAYLMNINMTTETYTDFYLNQTNTSVYLFEAVTNNSLSSFNISVQRQTCQAIGTNCSLFLKNASIDLNATKNGYLMQRQSVIVPFTITNSVNITGIGTENLTVTVYNATGTVTGASVNIRSLNYTYNSTFLMTTGNFSVILVNGTYNISINLTGYAIASFLYNSTPGTHYLNKSLYTTNSIFINFRDEDSNAIMSDRAVYLDLMSTTSTLNYTEGSGYLNLTLLVPENYTMRYYANGYTQRFYFIELADRTAYNVTLYLSNSSTNITATVYDEYNNELEDVEIQMLKYRTSDASYFLVDSQMTNFEGQAILRGVDLNSEYYKFILLYDGVVKQTTNPSYIFTDSISFQINTQALIAQGFFTSAGITYSFTNNTAAKTFTLTYVDPSMTISYACIKIKKNYGTNATTCQYSTSGSITASYDNTTSTIGDAIVVVDGEEYLLSQIIISVQDTPITQSKFGFFFVALLMLLALMLGAFRIEIGIILFPLPLILASMIGIITVPTYISVGIFLAAFVTVIIISYKD